MTAAPRTPASSDRPAVLHAAALRGDQHAWEQLVTPHLPCVRAVAHGWLRGGRAHAVDDVVQEVLLRAWTRLEQLEDPERVGAWMAAITRSVSLDRLRHGQRASALATLVQQLRDPAHVVAPVGEVAHDLGLPWGSTRVLLHRARTRLRAAYAAVALPAARLPLRLRERVEALDVPAALLPVAAVVAAGVAVLAVRAPAPPPEPVVASTPAPPGPEAPAPAARLPEPRTVTPVAATPTPAPAATRAAPPAASPTAAPAPFPTPEPRGLVSDQPPEGVEPDVTIGGDADDADERPGVEVFVSDLLDSGCDGDPLADLVGCDDPVAG